MTAWDETRDPESRVFVDGFGVPVWVSPSRGSTQRVVMTSHGLTNDHRDAPLFAEIRAVLEREGTTTLVEFDYPGSGSADGILADKRFSILRHTLVAVVDYVRANIACGAPIAIIARSMGGTVALSAFPETQPDALAAMSPPYHLVANLGRLQGVRADDGTYPLPAWADPSGQVKGAKALSGEFYADLEAEEQRLQLGVNTARNVLFISSTADPKVPAAEMDALWASLASGANNERLIFDSDHNYTTCQEGIVGVLVEWLGRVRARPG